MLGKCHVYYHGTHVHWPNIGHVGHVGYWFVLLDLHTIGPFKHLTVNNLKVNNSFCSDSIDQERAGVLPCGARCHALWWSTGQHVTLRSYTPYIIHIWCSCTAPLFKFVLMNCNHNSWVTVLQQPIFTSHSACSFSSLVASSISQGVLFVVPLHIWHPKSQVNMVPRRTRANPAPIPVVESLNGEE